MRREVPPWAIRGKVRFGQLYSGELDLAKGIAGSWEWTFKKLPQVIMDTVNGYRPEFVKYLKDVHINTFHVTFSNGFGIEAEKAQRECLRPFLKKCHQHNIKVIAYLDSVNIFWTSFFSDHPQAKDWLQLDKDGNPIHYGWLKPVPWRYRACLNNPNWINYQKQVIKLAIDMGFDGIYLDNAYLNKTACYCSCCRDKFKEYCREKLTKECDLPTEPNWSDPIWQSFIEFRYETLKEGLIEYRRYIKSANPELVFMFNALGPPTTMYPATDQTMRAIDTYALAKIADILYFELGFTFPRLENGRLISNIESLKYGISAGNGKNIAEKGYMPGRIPLTPGQVKVAVAEALSFSCTFNVYNFSCQEAQPMLEKAKIRKALAKYYGFSEKNENYYIGTETIADVAVLFSRPTQDWYCNDREEHDYPERRGFDQALIDLHIPFDIIQDEAISQNNLSKYKALILPNVACISQKQIEQIEGFVSKGGGLIATSETSLYDENYKKRENFGLAGVFGVGCREKRFTPKKSEYGKGKVLFHPQSIGKDYWLKQKSEDLKSIKEALEWVIEGGASLVTTAPKTTFINLLKQRERILVHLVNYNRDENSERMIPVKNIKIQAKVPVRVRNVFLISPDFKAKQNLEYEIMDKEEDQYVKFTIPYLETYNLVIIKLL